MYKWYLKYLKENHLWASEAHSFRDDKGVVPLDFLAIVMPYEVVSVEGNLSADNNDIGIALFNRDSLGAGLIAHEMTHCALWYDRLVNKNLNAEYGGCGSESEERLAYSIGELMTFFVNKCYKLNLFCNANAC